MANFAAVRDAFTDAFEGLGAVIFDYSPPVVSTPAIFVFPADPYAEIQTIGSANRVKLRFTVTAAVAANDNQAALNNLEDLMIDIITHLPSGAVISTFGAPAMTQVGVTNLLVSESTAEVTTQIS